MILRNQNRHLLKSFFFIIKHRPILSEFDFKKQNYNKNKTKDTIKMSIS